MQHLQVYMGVDPRGVCVGQNAQIYKGPVYLSNIQRPSKDLMWGQSWARSVKSAGPLTWTVNLFTGDQICRNRQKGDAICDLESSLSRPASHPVEKAVSWLRAGKTCINWRILWSTVKDMNVLYISVLHKYSTVLHCTAEYMRKY